MLKAVISSMNNMPESFKKPQATVREAALHILVRAEGGQASNRLINQALQDDSNLNINKNLLVQLVKGCLKWRGQVDAILEKHLKNGLSSLKPRARNILRLGAYEILHIEKVPNEIAVNEAVNLAKKFGTKGLAGMTNAVLRNIVRGLGKPEQTPSKEPLSAAAKIAGEQSHPLWLVERWINQYGEKEAQELCEADNRKWPLTLRVNTLKCSAAALKEALSDEGLATLPSSYCSDCLILPELPAGKKLHELNAFREGLFIVQDESSALISTLLAPRPGELVIDLCSAPGGKTTHLAALMENKGRILALDTSERRLNLVRENCERLGITIVETVEADSSRFAINEKADRILIDAPCSGLGVLGRKADARWNKASSDFSRLNRIQLSILKNASRLLKEGGSLVYSTCSIDPEENENIIQKFLQAFPSFSVYSPGENIPPDLVTPGKFFRSFPHKHKIGGAFGALLQKN